MNKDISLYVHIPFCVKKCLYCDFLSFNAESSVQEAYFDALEKEIEASARDYEEYSVKSVFFGGGTPSFPDEKRVCRILESIREKYRVDNEAEISIEVNPASAIYNKLFSYRKSGFNRISIGTQSLNDAELKKLGRVHNSAAFYETYEGARTAGFTNINIDVMSALPDQTSAAYLDTLKKVVGLKPEHISAYSLIVEEGTPFYDMELNLPSEDEDRYMYHETKKFLLENGYHRYEISNYALDNFECRHNKVYWERGNYLGLGLGASSMVENIRWSNVTDIDSYIKSLSDDSKLWKIRENKEVLSLDSQMEEFMFLGLRLVRGVSIGKFEKEFKKSIFEVYGDVISKYRELGLLGLSEEYLFLTEAGLDVSNTVMAEFLI